MLKKMGIAFIAVMSFIIGNSLYSQSESHPDIQTILQKLLTKNKNTNPSSNAASNEIKRKSIPEELGLTPDGQNQSIETQRKLVEAFVKKAVQYIKDNGETVAFKEFDKSDGLFKNGVWDIFVIDYDTTLLANSVSVHRVGKKELDILDFSDGKAIVQGLIEIAKKGGGWSSPYRWLNPVTETLQCKRSYIVPMGHYFVASGYYYPFVDGKCQ